MTGPGPQVPRWVRTLPPVLRRLPSERVALLSLVALAVAALLASLRFGAMMAPIALQVLPPLFAALLLGRRALRLLLVVVAGCVVASLLVQGWRDVRPTGVVVVVVTAALAHEISRSREETGLVGLRGDSVLAELRRRLSQQGEVPLLPEPWRAEARISPAGGGPFSGDFVVSAVTGPVLEVALVDVSGKGVAAGTRSLMLSGAMGGLLGARRPQDLLPAANEYLHRQAWDEGFATAVHLVLDLVTGSFVVESAGHPPAALFDAGSGRWSLLDAGGPALGLLPDVGDAVPATGVLERGDALLLYTDGLVEVPGRDLHEGIDKLLGEAERLVPAGFAGGCDALLRRVAAGEGDDRGVVLVWHQG